MPHLYVEVTALLSLLSPCCEAQREGDATQLLSDRSEHPLGCKSQVPAAPSSPEMGGSVGGSSQPSCRPCPPASASLGLRTSSVCDLLQLSARGPEESRTRLEVTQEQGGAQATGHGHGCTSCTRSCCQKHRAPGHTQGPPRWTLSRPQGPLPRPLSSSKTKPCKILPRSSHIQGRIQGPRKQGC